MNEPKWRCDVILLRKWMVGLKAHTNQPLSSLSFHSDWKISSANTTHAHLQPLKINSFALACCWCWKLFCRVLDYLSDGLFAFGSELCAHSQNEWVLTGLWRKFKHDLFSRVLTFLRRRSAQMTTSTHTGEKTYARRCQHKFCPFISENEIRALCCVWIIKCLFFVWALLTKYVREEKFNGGNEESSDELWYLEINYYAGNLYL
jgi:hypothetical protein